MAPTPRIADIGAVPDGLGEDLTRFLQQVQRLLRTGVQTGGLSGSGSGASGGGGTTIIGGGTSSGGLPGMDDPTPPPTPSGVTVDAGLSYVFFETAAPVFTMGAGYDRTRVYIAQYPATAPTPPTFGDAVLAYEFVGQIGAMPAEPATRLCVWLKWRSKAGYDSTTPAGGINGFIVETGQDVELLLKALTGSITSSELHAALGARIDLIDGPDTMAGSVAARVLAEATARGAAITSEQNARQAADTSLASSITTLTASVGSNAAAISSEQTARADADTALAGSISALASTVGGNTADITAEQMARANADSAIAGSVTTLAAQVGGSGGENLYMGNYLLEAGPGVYGVGGSILKSGGNDPYHLLSGETLTISAELWQDSESMSAGQVSMLFIYAAVANGVWVVTGVISSSALSPERKYTSLVLPADADMHTVGVGLYHQGGATNLSGAVFARRIQVERGEVATAYKAQSSVQAAAIQAANTARADGDYALAQSINTLSASVGENSTAIQQEATARANVDGHLSTLYTVRTSLTSGGRTVIGGFGLSGTSSATAGATIDFGVRADRFWIGPPNDGSAPGVGDILPFIVQATPTTINGLAVPAGVYINDAFIRNGTITNAKIGNAAIDDAKIANLSAAKITAGSLAIGQYIQSSNYIPGTQGWRINADGSAQFMAASIAGQLTAGQIDTRGLSIKDASGNIILAAGSALPAAYAAAGTKNSEVALGTNLVYNDCFEEGIQGWTIGDNLMGGAAIYRVVDLSDAWRLSPVGSRNGSVQYVQQSGTDANPDAYCDILSDPIPVEVGSRYLVSAFTGAGLCSVHLFSYFYDGSGAVVGNSYSTGDFSNSGEKSGGSSLSDYKRLHSIADIPAGALYLRLVVRKLNTAPGGGLGSYIFFTRAQVERTGPDAVTPGPWSPSGISNPTAIRNNNPITPANVSTYISSAAIGSAQIADLSVGDAKVGNFIKSFNFNGAIDAAGNVTNIGTTGWALGRAGAMVVDAAHIRGRLTASQINATTLTAITANLGDVTAGTLSNSTGSTFINMNATGSQVLLRSGAFDYGTGRYPVQITADGEALFTKRVASGTWSGSALYFQRTTVGSPPSITSGIVVIDTGYNYPYGQSINRDFIARVSTFTTYGGDTTAPGQYSHAVSIGLSARRGIPLFTTGAAQNQSSNIFGANNDRIYIFMEVNMIHDSVSSTVFARNVVSISWNLLLGV